MKQIKRTRISEALRLTNFGEEVNVKGWVRTRRGNKNVGFVALNDGSTINNIQIVINISDFDEELLRPVATGACISVNGELVKSQGQGQSVEIRATEIEVYGS
ncbi:MAG: asparagine--tRNA ligase, partial [Proteiniphilum sp.]|nr:asparagine--tRNA ligase [Proteiniphilum sp.]